MSKSKVSMETALLDRMMNCVKCVKSCEVFHKGFRSFHRDRVMGGGGVFILVREDIVHVEDAFPNDNNN